MKKITLKAWTKNSCVDLRVIASGKMRSAKKYAWRGPHAMPEILESGTPLRDRAVTYKVCLVGPKPGTVQIRRAGRRGGIRAKDKVGGGLVACNSNSSASGHPACVRDSHSIYLAPGGGGLLRKRNVPVYGRYKRRRR